MIPRRSLPAILAISLTVACGSSPVTTTTVLGYTVVVKTPPPASASAGSPVPIVFAVTENESDGSSKPANGKSFTVTVTAGGGTINGAASTALTTAADGSASLMWVLGPTVETQTLRGSISSTQYVDVNVAATALPTLLVTNGSCSAGGCRTLEVRAFVSKFTVPGQLPTGMGFVGYVPSGQWCLVFPPSWTLTITGSDSTGRVQTTIITWTPHDASSIYLVAVDSALYHGGPQSQAQFDSIQHGVFPFDGFFGEPTVGETLDFVVGGAPGWAVSFPSAPASGAKLTQAAVCRP